MALVMSCLPNLEFKNSYLKNFTVCGCKYSEDASQKVNRLLKRDIGKCSWVTFPSFGKRIAFARSPSNKMVSNGYISEDMYKNKIYRRLDSCLVIPPPNGKKPRAIIKFLGGAFIGAVPEVTYGHLMNLLAKDGFLIISVPYNVTFDHAQAAREVYERFNACMDMLLTSGLANANIVFTDINDLPVYSVGHSNGALLQLLTGSYFSEKIPKANAIISFNNRPASEAVPYFEQFGPIVSELVPMMEASPVYEMARNASGDAWKALLDTAGPMIQAYDQEALVSLTKFVDQLPSVMNQVFQWLSFFISFQSLLRTFVCTLGNKTFSPALGTCMCFQSVHRKALSCAVV